MFNKTYITQESEKSTEQINIIEKAKIIKGLISQREELIKRLIALSLIRFYDGGTVIPFRKQEADTIQQEVREFDKLYFPVISDFLK